MKLLLAGGSGFIGKSIIESFDNKKLKKFRIKKIFVIARRANKFFKKFNKKKIEFIRGDLSKIKKLPNSDIAIFLAESTNIKDYNDKKIVAKKHKKTIKNFCNLIKKNKKIKLLYCSSGSVYEPSNKKISEKNKLNYKKQVIKSYKNVYNLLKLYSESTVKNLAKVGIKCSIARCFTFVGVNIPRKSHFLIGNLINNILAEKELFAKSKFKVIRSFMHTDDLSKCLFKIMKRNRNNCDIYNVGSDEAVTIKKLAKLISNKFNKEIDFKKPISDAKNLDYYVPSIKKAEKILKLKIKYNLKQSLKELY